MSVNGYEEEKKRLSEIYNESEKLFVTDKNVSIPNDISNLVDAVVKKSEQNKAILAVTVTSLLKKITTPSQDIRYHQSGMVGGYSGRTLDTEVVTPFLKEKNLPHMSSSGWLTRSLEQAVPYDLNYTGSMKPKSLKKAFLSLLNGIQVEGWDPTEILKYVFLELIRQRNVNTTLELAKPRDKTIDWIVKTLMDHFNGNYGSSGASRLPVLAIFAAYKQFMEEVRRYDGKTLAELKPHNSPDTRSGDVGDIQVLNENGSVFEAVEVKHNIKITVDLLETAYNKFRTQQVDRYYLLTTKHNDPIDFDGISKKIIEIKSNHGCQVIVNGVESSMKYYLRLLSNTNQFISNYVDLVKNDSSVKYDHRMKWNEIVSRRN